MTENSTVPGEALLHCQRLLPVGASANDAMAPETPWLVLLHGLFGSGDDWQALCPWLSNWPLLLVDLPGHGRSVDITVRDFDETNRQLYRTLLSQGVKRYWLLGYSLGGRIALFHATQPPPPLPANAALQLLGVLIEGGNPGLQDQEQRQARCEHDRLWAQRIRHESLPDVLDDWYCQPVFADLTPTQRRTLVTLRSRNHGPAVAAMLEATSLGRQPWLLDELRQRRLPFGYLCGAEDHRFQALAQHYVLPLLSIPHAGHNAHRANPAQYAQQIRAFLASPSAERGQTAIISATH